MENRRNFLQKAGMAALTVPFVKSFSFDASRKIRVALVGLGRYAGYLAEGIAVSKHCEVAGIVTGTPAKIPVWRNKYSIPEKNVYNYDSFDQIAGNKDIDLVYVVLPNAMHKEYVIRAARSGKHVIVEKPMAISAAECEEMIAECNKAGVQLAVGYRLHFEPYNKEMMRMGQQKVFGEVRHISAALSYNTAGAGPGDWHVVKKLSGGGPLTNLGVYCIQGARYVTGLEPIAVTARFGPVTQKDIFAEVEESIYWQMEFPNGAIADCSTSYTSYSDYLMAAAENGHFELSPAISYGPFVGKSSDGPMNFPEINQQQVQMDEMAKYLLANQPFPDHISGLEGLKDLKVIDAVYKAAKSGERVVIG